MSVEAGRGFEVHEIRLRIATRSGQIVRRLTRAVSMRFRQRSNKSITALESTEVLAFCA